MQQNCSYILLLLIILSLCDSSFTNLAFFLSSKFQMTTLIHLLDQQSINSKQHKPAWTNKELMQRLSAGWAMLSDKTLTLWFRLSCNFIQLAFQCNQLWQDFDFTFNFSCSPLPDVFSVNQRRCEIEPWLHWQQLSMQTHERLNNMQSTLWSFLSHKEQSIQCSQKCVRSYVMVSWLYSFWPSDEYSISAFFSFSSFSVYSVNEITTTFRRENTQSSARRTVPRNL